MKLRNYLPLLTDVRTIIRTLRQVYGTPRQPRVAPYRRGDVQRVANRIHPAWTMVRITHIRPETRGTRTLVVAAISGALPPFVPGQHFNLVVKVHGVHTSRPMTISAPPRVGDPQMELTVRGPALDHLQVGDALRLSGPEGEFHFHPVRDGEDLVFIAAGHGIMPFMGMIEDILARWPATRVGLLYGSRTAEAAIFLDRLDRLARRGGLRLRCALSSPAPKWDGERGRIDLPMIQRFLHGEALGPKTFFIGGPGEMEHATTNGLEQLGVRPGQIRLEHSGAFEDVTRRPDWPAAVGADQLFEVRIGGREEPILARAGEPLLSALERAGVCLPALCRTGRCGACRTQLTRGEVWAGGSGQRGAESVAGFIHPCVSHPVSDICVEVQSNRRA